MIKYIFTLIIGLVIGYFLTSTYKKENFGYDILEEDCVIANVGALKKGTKLKYLESTDEGITRYILYLNTKGIEMSPHDDEYKDLIIPYFLFSEEQKKW